MTIYNHRNIWTLGRPTSRKSLDGLCSDLRMTEDSPLHFRILPRQSLARRGIRDKICVLATQFWANHLDSGALESVTHMPVTLKSRNFCCRIFETMQIETLGITSASSAFAHSRTGREKGKNMPPLSMFMSVCVCVCVCLCVCMFVYYTVVSLNMKIWERFCLKLKSQHFKWISTCLPLVSMDGGSPTPPGNMIITSFFCISL